MIYTDNINKDYYHPWAVHCQMQLTPTPPTEDKNEPQPTHLAPRTIHPIARSVTYTSHDIKVYTSDDEDQSSQAMLPPLTTALAVQKPVR